MLKDITVLRGNEVYLHKEYAISFKNPEVLPQLLKSIDEESNFSSFLRWKSRNRYNHIENNLL